MLVNQDRYFRTRCSPLSRRLTSYSIFVLFFLQTVLVPKHCICKRLIGRTKYSKHNLKTNPNTTMNNALENKVGPVSVQHIGVRQRMPRYSECHCDCSLRSAVRSAHVSCPGITVITLITEQVSCRGLQGQACYGFISFPLWSGQHVSSFGNGFSFPKSSMV